MKRKLQDASTAVLDCLMLKDDANEQYRIGNLELALQLYEKAINHLVAKAEVNPSLMSLLHSNCAACYMKTQQWPEAMQWSDAAVRYDQSNVQARVRRGVTAASLGKYSLACDDLVFALHSDASLIEEGVLAHLQRCYIAMQPTYQWKKWCFSSALRLRGPVSLKTPPPRFHAACFCYRGSFYLFGGMDGRDTMNDLWRFSLDRCSWDRIDSQMLSTHPSPRNACTATVIGKVVYFFGGDIGSLASRLSLTVPNDNGIPSAEEVSTQALQRHHPASSPTPGTSSSSSTHESLQQPRHQSHEPSGHSVSFTFDQASSDTATISTTSESTIDTSSDHGTSTSLSRYELMPDNTMQATTSSPSSSSSSSSSTSVSSTAATAIHADTNEANSTSSSNVAIVELDTNSYMFALDLDSLQWCTMNVGLATSLSTPPLSSPLSPMMIKSITPPSIWRYGHSSVVYDRSLYIFGGIEKDTGCYLDQLLRFDTDARTLGAIWSEPRPQARAYHASWVHGKNMYIWGGAHGGAAVGNSIQALNDLWAFDFETHHWTLVNQFQSEPEARYEAKAAVVGNKVLLYGGYSMHSRAATSGTGAFFDDLHELDMASGVWSQVSRIGGDSMPRLAAYGLCTTPEGQVFYLAGYGCSSNSSSNHASAFAFFSPKSYNTVMELQIIPRQLPAVDEAEESLAMAFERRPSSEGIATLHNHDDENGNQQHHHQHHHHHHHADLKAHEHPIDQSSRDDDSQESSPPSSPSSASEPAPASLDGDGEEEDEELETGRAENYQARRVSDDNAVSQVNALLEPALYASHVTDSLEHRQKRRRLEELEQLLPSTALQQHGHDESQQQEPQQQQQQQQQLPGTGLAETSFLR